MKEKWKPIRFYEGNYEVSNKGRIRSLPKNKIVKIQITKKGYSRVQLSQNRIRKNHLVHRLVATAFIPNPENKEAVNHKDFNRKNDSITNLEWVTAAENIQHSIEHFIQARLNQKMSCTNYHNIYPHGKRFLVRVKRNKKFIISKTFPTLDQAVQYLRGTAI